MIKNITKNTKIAEKFEVARTNWQKFWGLMFRKIKPIIFEFNKETNKSFHTFFVKEPIDIIFLDEEWTTVEIKHNLQPKSIYQPRKKYMFAIELPAQTAYNTKTEEGDTIHIIK